MNAKSLAGFAVGAALLVTHLPASGQLYDNFDSYTPGSIHGQGGWEGWTGIASVAGWVTTDQSSSPPNSLEIIRGDDTVKTFSGVTSGFWSLSIQQYIPSSSSGGTYVILMNQYPANLNWSEQIYCDLTGGTIGSDMVPGSSVPLIKDEWITLRFDINLDTSSVSSFYNNTLVATHAWHSGSGLNQLAALDLYADEDSVTGQVGAVYYDNLILIPEPSTVSLLLLGGVALLLRPRRRV